MKKLLLIIFFIALAPSARAVPLCKKNNPCAFVASHPWKSNTSISGSAATYTCNPTCQTASSSSDTTWTLTITNGLGRTGSISGQSRCSNSNSTNPPIADHSNGTYCWCRVTNIVDSTNNQTCPADSNGAPWVFDFNYSAAAYCRQGCAGYCANDCVRPGTDGSCSRSALLTFP
jgi:hypothetical protein